MIEEPVDGVSGPLVAAPPMTARRCTHPTLEGERVGENTIRARAADDSTASVSDGDDYDREELRSHVTANLFKTSDHSDKKPVWCWTP